jgi:hypothetical protein
MRAVRRWRMLLELSEDERETLEAVLENVLRELREEVYHAEDTDFKKQLKGEEALIRGVLAKLRAPK